MRTTQQFSITLPHEMARMVEAKVSSGAYGSVEEVVYESLRVMMEQDKGVEHWLRTEVVAAYDAHMADPSRAIPAEDVLARIKARRKIQ